MYIRLSKDDQSDYDRLNEDLLANSDLTERALRRRFRDSRPEKSETFRQLGGRLVSFLDKWLHGLAMAQVEKTYEAVCNILVWDQFLYCYSRELYIYIKPQPFKSVVNLAHEADCSLIRSEVFPCVLQRRNNSIRVSFSPK